MADLKTTPTEDSVREFLNHIADDQRREDCRTLTHIMQRATGSEPKMWGESIVGFGNYAYKYASGREGEWFLTGFAPRKQNLTLYIMTGFDRHEELMGKLGKYTTGKSCLYVKRLSDIDQNVLTELISESIAALKDKHGS